MKAKLIGLGCIHTSLSTVAAVTFLTQENPLGVLFLFGGFIGTVLFGCILSEDKW